MKPQAASLVVIIALSGCTGMADDSDELTPGMMAAAIQQLITVDHTFGADAPPFTEFLIQSRVDPNAGSPDSSSGPSRDLTDAEQAAIEAVFESLGPVRWIDDPTEWRTDDLLPVIDGSVILGVGEPTFDRGGGLVPVSLWCGGLCGTWLTYRLELVDGDWEVTGTDGTVAIS